MRRGREVTHEDRMEDARQSAYAPIAHMNREARRTAHGRQLVAEAEARAVKAENEVLKAELELLKR